MSDTADTGKPGREPPKDETAASVPAAVRPNLVASGDQSTYGRREMTREEAFDLWLAHGAPPRSPCLDHEENEIVALREAFFAGWEQGQDVTAQKNAG